MLHQRLDGRAPGRAADRGAHPRHAGSGRDRAAASDRLHREPAGIGHRGEGRDIGTLPGELDRSSLGHAGKYTYCIAENEAESPWPALHTTRGFRADQNAVTIFAAYAPHQYSNRLSATPEGVLATACAHMRISAGSARQPQYAMVFAGEHMAIMKKAGWSREDVQKYCFEHTQSTVAELKRVNMLPGDVTPEDERAMYALVEAPQDFLVIAAGGRAGVQSAFIPGWGSKRGSQSVSREIRRPG